VIQHPAPVLPRPLHSYFSQNRLQQAAQLVNLGS
jgi:hypothetical protein